LRQDSNFGHLAFIFVKSLLILLEWISGGTFAIYSLICRYANVSLIPNQQAEDCEVSNYKLEVQSNRLRRASWIKSKLEKSKFAKLLLLLVSMLGTSMVIGDGVLTPCISG
jgi:KUP system potassium uptake protein